MRLGACFWVLFLCPAVSMAARNIECHDGQRSFALKEVGDGFLVEVRDSAKENSLVAAMIGNVNEVFEGIGDPSSFSVEFKVPKLNPREPWMKVCSTVEDKPLLISCYANYQVQDEFKVVKLKTGEVIQKIPSRAWAFNTQVDTREGIDFAGKPTEELALRLNYHYWIGRTVSGTSSFEGVDCKIDKTP